MSCKHPSYVFRKVNKMTGESETKWIGSLDSSEARLYLGEDYSGKKDINGTRAESYRTRIDVIQVPCGRCIGCRLDMSRSWADRMTYHSIHRKDEAAYFLTVTYDDDYIEDLRSEKSGLFSLCFDHIDKFIKDLRNMFRSVSIDFYLSGEYGGQFLRPHFHIIAYGCDIPDLNFWKLNDNGDPIYTSSKIESLWKYGFATISKFDWHTAAYTAGYVQKKLYGKDAAFYDAAGVEPERMRCSRRPGIAFDYYCNHAEELWANDGLAVPRSVNSSGKLGLCRYFRKLAEDKGIGLEAFRDWKLRSNDRMNLLNPLNVENSSFDFDRIDQLMKFEERELLRKVNK